MKITHYICPRGCGKSTKAREMQLRDPENILLFSAIWKPVRLRGRGRFKKIIFDEYLGKFESIVDRRRFIDWFYRDVVNALQEDGEVIFMSTPDKLYSAKAIILAALVKYPNYLSDYGVLDLEDIKADIQEINDNFLNPTQVNIIKTNFGAEPRFSYVSICHELGEEAGKTQFSGEYIDYKK